MGAGEMGVGKMGVGKSGIPLISNRSYVVVMLWCSRFLVIYLCQFELRLNHFSFVNILCSFNVMIPLSLRKSFTLVPYTLQFVLPLKINSTSKFDF